MYANKRFNDWVHCMDKTLGITGSRLLSLYTPDMMVIAERKGMSVSWLNRHQEQMRETLLERYMNKTSADKIGAQMMNKRS